MIPEEPRDGFGIYFTKKRYVPEALPVFEHGNLPSPVLDAEPGLVEMYWFCWDVASKNLRSPAPGSPLVSNWLDAAFSGNIFQWDTCFKKKTSCGFWPMIAGVASQAQVKRLVAHLKDEKKFWRPFVFPTLSADEPEYKPDGDYWLGAVWAPTNYAIIKGLELYGEEDFATEAALRYVRAMFEVYKRTGTVWENYAPESMSQGTPAKPDFVGWSGIGPITLLIENVLGFRPDGVRKQLAWRLARHDRHGIERFRFGTVQTDLLYDGKGSVCVRTNEPFTLALNGVEYKLAKGEHRLAAKPR